MQHHLHCHNLDPPLYMLAEYESMRDPRAIARVTAVLMLTMIVMPLDHSERRPRPHLRAGASSGHPATLHQTRARTQPRLLRPRSQASDLRPGGKEAECGPGPVHRGRQAIGRRAVPRPSERGGFRLLRPVSYSPQDGCIDWS